MIIWKILSVKLDKTTSTFKHLGMFDISFEIIGITQKLASICQKVVKGDSNALY